MSEVSQVRRSEIKSYISGGKRYVYHRPTGKPLPNLPHDDPKFIAAVQEVEQKARGERISHPPQFGENIDIDIRVTIDCCAYQVAQCVPFILDSKCGATLLYHSGDLASDSEEHDQVRQIQRYMLLCASFELIYFKRQRIEEGWSHYFAVRTDMSLRGLPSNAIRLGITPDEYFGLSALLERQAATSTTRAIRDALSISDHRASQMRQAFIDRGWLTDTRPPEFTETGLEMLK